MVRFPEYVDLFCTDGWNKQNIRVGNNESGISYTYLIKDGKIQTPYGYGGAFFWGDVSSYKNFFWNIFDEYKKKFGIVHETARLSLFPEEILDHPGKKEVKKNIVVDLSKSEKGIWKNFEQKVRQNIRCARRSGVTVVSDEGYRFNDFLRIYRGTMDRVKADDFYFFSDLTFDKLNVTLRGRYRYFYSVIDGRVVSTELVLISDDKVYSFLGGTDEEFFDMRPNELLKWEVMKWAKAMGKKWYVLGGGKEADDGIYRYKRGFAPDGVRPYYVSERRT